MPWMLYPVYIMRSKNRAGSGSTGQSKNDGSWCIGLADSICSELGEAAAVKRDGDGTAYGKRRIRDKATTGSEPVNDGFANQSP